MAKTRAKSPETPQVYKQKGEFIGTERLYKQRSSISSVKKDDISSVIRNPSYQDVANALDSIEIPINESRKNVRKPRHLTLCFLRF